jgi:hypothetical protein
MLDPARQPQPGLDRFLHYHQEAQDIARGQLLNGWQDLDRARVANEQDWIGAIKRQLYFAADDESLPTNDAPIIRSVRLLPYRHAEHYIAMLNGTADKRQLRERIARGLLRSDRLPISGSEQKLSLRVAYSESQQLAVVKQFPLDDFVVEVPQPYSGTLLEAIPELVIFYHVRGTPRIEPPLELFELLMRLADGADPQSEEYKPLLEELAPFKSALLLRETNELVLIESQRRIYTVTQHDKQIVLSAEEGARQ